MFDKLITESLGLIGEALESASLSNRDFSLSLSLLSLSLYLSLHLSR